MDNLTVISLGAGVQSSTLALMAACGEVTPMPELAVFADTQAEPMEVYQWLDWLETKLPFKVLRVTKGSLIELSTRVRTAKVSGNKYLKHNIPAFIQNRETGKVGLNMRHCTTDFKITPIHQALSKLRHKRPIIQWLGISYDEVMRMKPSRKKWITHRYPLVDLKMTRADCISWMAKHGFPKPPRSACVFCPYHSDDEWRRLKTESPGEFAKAVTYENLLQERSDGTVMRGKPFLHRSAIPLNEIDFTAKQDKQQDFFNNECEGMCGV